MIHEILAAVGLTEHEPKIIDSAQVPSRDDVPR